MTTALVTGVGLGFVIAAQVGPITLLCIRIVLRGRLASGLGIAVGVAAVDLTYAALGVAGAAQLLRVPALRLALGLVGAAVILGLGVTTVWHTFRVRPARPPWSSTPVAACGARPPASAWCGMLRPPSSTAGSQP
jgi:threonine/homoserine/homoserine lactone efflux protein